MLAVPVKDRVFRDPVHGLIEFKGDGPADRRSARHARDAAAAPHQADGLRVARLSRRRALAVRPRARRVSHRAARDAAARARRRASRCHVKVAALLHDVGHGPFSHAWEHVFAGHDHERWGARIATEDAELRAALEALEPGLPDDAAARSGARATSRTSRASSCQSQLDVDRLDYLLRDGHYSGAGYATYDLDWIIHAIQVATVRTGADDPTDLVVDYRRGMYAVEQYLFARSYMYAQVYHHKTVRAAEWMFIKTLERFAAARARRRRAAGLADRRRDGARRRRSRSTTTCACTTSR